MMAIAYAISWAKKLEMPLSICLGIGSSQGAHLGTNALSQYVDYVANFSQVSVSAAAGNEGNTRNHSTGIFFSGKGADRDRTPCSGKRAGVYHGILGRSRRRSTGFPSSHLLGRYWKSAVLLVQELRNCPLFL